MERDQAEIETPEQPALPVPHARNPWHRLTEARVTYALKVLLLILAALYLGGMILTFLGRISTVVYILIGAIFFAYLIYPAVERLHRRMPRALAVAIVYAVILAVVLVIGWVVIPNASSEFTSFIATAPELARNVQAVIDDPNNPVLAPLPEPIRAEVSKIPSAAITWLRVHGAEAAGHVLQIVISTFATVATFVIVPLLAAYLLIDVDRLRAGLLRVVPTSRWETALAFIQDVDRVIGGFIRGQLLVAATVGVLLTIALLLMHVPYAFLLGLLAGVGDLVPYVGAIITFVPAVASAFVHSGPVNALIVALLFVGIYELEGHVIAPTIVSSQVKLTPFSVLLAVLIGAELGGIVGMLVAVPVAGILRVVFLRVTAPSQAPARPGANEKTP